MLSSWNANINTFDALSALRNTLKQWNKKIFGDVHKKKEKLVKDISRIQDLLDLHQTDALIREEETLIKELDVVMEQEEILWYQKSREKWISLGDRNTKFFHTSTIIRRRRNCIDMLKDAEGRWISNAQELEHIAIEYYKRLYSLEDVEVVARVLPQEGFMPFTREEGLTLNKVFRRWKLREQSRVWAGLKRRDRMAFNRFSTSIVGMW